MTGTNTPPFGIRVVAVLEVAKAALLVVVEFVIVSLINRDASVEAEKIVRRLHLNPFSHYPHIFISAVENLTNSNLAIIASLVAVDAVLRIVVAYGLWHNLRWGKWLGVAAAGVYIPLELYGMAVHPSPLKVATLVINVLIVLYLGWSLRSEEVQTVPAQTVFDA